MTAANVASDAASGTTARRRIGLFGGSFDPVHNAHLALARLALQALTLDELRWLPVGRPWQKTRRLAAAHDREAMVRLAIAGEPRFQLSTSELERSGPSYTVDTVRLLQADEASAADWFLLMGQDQYVGFHTWYRWQELLQRVTLAVAGRPGGAARAEVAAAGLPHIGIALPPMAVSSTVVRERLAAGQPIADLVPAAVAGYIEQHRLYPPSHQGNPPARS